MNIAFTNLHLVLQSSHVSLLHQFVERYKLSEALSHRHDFSLSGQVQRQLKSYVQPHLPDTATHMTGFKSQLCYSLVHFRQNVLFYQQAKKMNHNPKS